MIEIRDQRGMILDYLDTNIVPERGDIIKGREVLRVNKSGSVIFKYIVVCL